MSLLGRPLPARSIARGMQGLATLGARRVAAASRARLPEYTAETSELVVPATPPVPVVVYRPGGTVRETRPPVHVNFHGGGYVLGQFHHDDPLCRAIAALAGAIVIDVDYAVAPQHPFPVPTRQAYEVVRWVAEHGEEHGWDGTRLTIGGQSAGGAIAAAVARQALRGHGPRILLQTLHYPPLDLTVPAAQKPSPLDRPRLRPWMGTVFDSVYVPDAARRADPLVSPANAADDESLTGIAPALMIVAADDILRDEGVRYAERLAAADALVELAEVAGADHGYDGDDDGKARESYRLIAHHVARSTSAGD